MVIPKLDRGLRDIFLMDALHDDDDGVLLQIVQSRRDSFMEPVQRRAPLDLGFTLGDVVRVIDDELVTPFPGADTADRRSLHPSGFIVAKILIGSSVLV
jgi:hypothetical protein